MKSTNEKIIRVSSHDLSEEEWEKLLKQAKLMSKNTPLGDLIAFRMGDIGILLDVEFSRTSDEFLEKNISEELLNKFKLAQKKKADWIWLDNWMEI